MRGALAKAAEATFVELGIAGADVDDIASRAGLPRGSFYAVFESKEAAVEYIVKDWLARCAARYQDPAAYPDDFDDSCGLVDFILERDARLYEFFWETRATLRFIEDIRSEYLHLLLPFRAEMRRRAHAWLEQGRRNGLVRADVDLDLGAGLMSGAFEQLTMSLIRLDEKPPIEQWVLFARETFIRGYGTTELVGSFERRHRRSEPVVLESTVPSSSLRWRPA